jgi:hypothetical protein
MANKDDENRLQRSLNSLERRNKLARRHDDRVASGQEPGDDEPVTPYSMSGAVAVPVTVPGAEPEALAGDPAGVEGGRKTTDGMPPRAPGQDKPPGVHTDHLAATVAALRHLATSRTGFDIVVLDPSTEPLSGTRITSVGGGTPRVTPVAIEVEDDGVARTVAQDDPASELAAVLRRKER